MDRKSFMEERRSFERANLQKPASYIYKGKEYSCELVDISLKGIQMRVKGILDFGDVLLIKIESQSLSSKVVRINGNIVGVTFDPLTDSQIEYIMKLKAF